MIYTSYFNNPNLSSVFKQMRFVSIARSEPDNYCGYVFKPLAPSWNLIKMKYNPEIYTERYKSEILSKLDSLKVGKFLDNCVLLCWEKPDKFCHRHIVSDWLFDAGFDITELSEW